MYKLSDKAKTKLMLENLNENNNYCTVCRKKIDGVAICDGGVLCNKTARGNYVYFHEKCFMNQK